MEIKTTTQLNITLSDEDADNFKGAIKKLSEQETKIGFTNSKLTDKERELLKSISEKF